MPAALQLYDHPDSTNAIKIRLLLAELGLEAERIEVPLRGERPAGYADVHPFGLVPTLVDGDLAVTESNTALRYLAERADRWDLRGADARARARVDVLLDSLSLEVRPHLWAVEEFAAYGAGIDAAEQAARVAALTEKLQAYDRLIDPDGPHALGPQLTIADCAIAGRLLHLAALPLDPTTASRVRRVVEAARRRPSFARAAP